MAGAGCVRHLLCGLLVIKVFVSQLQAHPSLLLVMLKLRFCRRLLALLGIVNRGVQRAIVRPEEEEGTGFFLSASSSQEGPLSNPALLQWQQFLPVAAAESISQFF